MIPLVIEIRRWWRVRIPCIYHMRTSGSAWCVVEVRSSQNHGRADAELQSDWIVE
jgi:hypothetical protein